jgi:hypothetical protein
MASRSSNSPARSLAPDEPTPPSGWIVSARHDLALFANLAWVLAWLVFIAPADTFPRVEFWQIYFLTTPHRWLTLVLVAVDPDRRAGRSTTFVGIALAIAAVTAVATVASVPLLCLLVVDYLWNAWHFGAQHAGLARIYGKRLGDPRRLLETWSIRFLVVYTSVRLAGWSTGWAENVAASHWLLPALDAVVLAPALLVLSGELARLAAHRLGKCSYLASVVGLYASLLVSVNLAQPLLTVTLATAASAFHAIEYLALVSHYARGRQQRGSAGLFRSMAREWTLLLAAYLVVLGVVGLWLDHWARDLWLAVNLGVAFMHYAFDGMIWKLRSPATAQALGISEPSLASSLVPVETPVRSPLSRALEPAR